MKAAVWVVTKDDTRSGQNPDGSYGAGIPNQCFYCTAPLGAPHDADCVIPKRTVVVRYTIETIRIVPESWDHRAINFQMNDSSWCASNLPDMLNEIYSGEACMCSDFKGEFVREATVQDEERRGFSIQNKSILHNNE